ncbi:MAG: hypothetical protein MI754_04765 [Chromatiales bacterium]|nr:hypothetical protein [Chromatiales bacterium]
MSPSSVTEETDIFQPVSSLPDIFSLLRVALAFLALLGCANPVFAVKSIEFSLGRLSSADWSSSDIKLAINLAEPGRFSLTAKEITHPTLPAPINELSIHCLKGQLLAQQVTCQDGQGLIDYLAFKQETFALTFNWKFGQQLIDVKADDIPLKSGDMDLALQFNNQRWEASIKSPKQRIERLAQIAPQFKETLSAWSAMGSMGLNLDLKGDLTGLQTSDWAINFSALQFADPAGSVFAEELAGSWKGKVDYNPAQWQSTHRLSIKSGAALTPALYLGTELGAITAQASLKGDDTAITLQQFDFTHKNLLRFRASGVIKPQSDEPLSALKLETKPVDLSKLFTEYFQPVLAGTSWEGFTLSKGRGEFAFTVKKGEPQQIKMVLSDLGIELSSLSNNLLSLQGGTGDINWSKGNPSNPSTLSWEGGALYNGVTLGNTQLQLLLSGAQAVLQQPTSLPILDGHLQAEILQVDWSGEDPEIQFSGYLAPINMRQLSVALGLPELSGQLSGMIPNITYEAGNLHIGGIALIKLFGGNVRIKNLQLDDLLDVLPVLQADIELKGLDLETLTETFSFGKITGKLDGEIDQLRLEAWEPVSFDAWFATPENDRSRRRISQKAVDNISNLGGRGLSGAASRGFLRFFETFGYSKLGIRCRLENGICQMGGVNNGKNGYYLVKGGGLPRIDIMGFNRTIDWIVLVGRLKEIATGQEAPRIE